METVFGLPTHPLVVHAAIVLLPLAALGAIIMGFSPRFSVRFGPVVVAIAGVGVIAAGVAKLTGEALAEKIGVSNDHLEAGDVLPFIAAAFFVLVLALWLLDRNRGRTVVIQLLAAVVIIAALFVTFWVARVGHSGAEMVWSGVGQQLSGS